MSLRFPICRPAAVALALTVGAAACSDASNPQGMTDMAPAGADLGPAPLLAVTGTDFTAGSLSTVDTASRAVRKNVAVVDAQPIVRAFGSKVYVLDQTHGALRVYDAAKDFQNPVEFSISKPGVIDAAQANPYDVYFEPQQNQAYVTLYGSFGSTQVTPQYAIAVLDLASPQSGILRFVALDKTAEDTDNNVEATQLVECNNTVYVLLQNLDRNKNYAAAGPGRLAVLSKSTPGPARYITLAGQNPTALAVLPGCTEAIVGSAADQISGTQAGLGGIERVDLVGQKTLGLALTDVELGGNVSTLDAVDATRVFTDLAVKTGTTFNNTVYAVDVLAKKKGAAVLGPMSFVPAVRVLDGRLVVLSAGTAKAGQLATGLYLGAASGAALTDAALDVGLPPQSVALVYR